MEDEIGLWPVSRCNLCGKFVKSGLLYMCNHVAEKHTKKVEYRPMTDEEIKTAWEELYYPKEPLSYEFDPPFMGATPRKSWLKAWEEYAKHFKND